MQSLALFLGHYRCAEACLKCKGFLRAYIALLAASEQGVGDNLGEEEAAAQLSADMRAACPIPNASATSRPGGASLTVSWINRARHPVAICVLDFEGREAVMG